MSAREVRVEELPAYGFRASRSLRASIAIVPVGVWLAGIVLLSAVARYRLFADTMPGFRVVPDELVYSELAKGVAWDGAFSIRGEFAASNLVFGIVYPLLVAPAYAVADGAVSAYALVKGINCLLMSLAAVPAYLLARRVLGGSLSLVAAVVAILVPSMLHTATVMTENAFYPLFLASVVLMLRALESPTGARQLAALGGIAVCVGTRPQAVALVPAFLSATIAAGALDARAEARGPARRALLSGVATWRLSWLVVGGLGALAVAFLALSQMSALSLLGAYETFVRSLSPSDVPRWFLYHVAGLDLYLGVAVFAAAAVAFVAILRSPHAPRPQRLLAVVTATSAFWLILLASAFASQPDVLRVQERYVFYVVPLLIVLALLWVTRRVPESPRLLVAGALAAAVLPAVLPYGDLLGNGRHASTLALTPFRAFEPEAYRTAGVALGVLGAGAFLLFSRRHRPLVIAPLLLAFAVTTSTAQHEFAALARDSLRAGIGGKRDWIDRAVGPDAQVATLWTGQAKRGWLGWYTIWENEFFNRSVHRIYVLREPHRFGLPQERVTTDRATGLLRDSSGRALRASYALTDTTTPVAGSELARDPATGMVLYRVDGDLRLAAVARPSAPCPPETVAHRGLDRCPS
jgi:hypothetical protein